MRMFQLIVLLVPTVVGGLLGGHIWNLSTNAALFMGLPPLFALLIWAGSVSE